MTLEQWLAQRSMTRRELAKVLGVHPVTVTKWTRGHARPRGQTMHRIEAQTAGAVRPADFYRGGADGAV